MGLTSDDTVGDGISTLKDLCFWRFSVVNGTPLSGFKRQLCDTLTNGMAQNDKLLVEGMLSRADMRYLKGNQGLEEKAIRSIVKSLHFLKFFDSATKVKVNDAKGKRRPCLDVFGDILGVALKHTEHDRDLIVMRHNFTIEDQQKKQFKHTSTFIGSGESHASGGISIMSKTVGYTCGIGARMVLTGKVPQRGVVSPIYPEIYNPILRELENYGVRMIEESERPGGLATASNRPRL